MSGFLSNQKQSCEIWGQVGARQCGSEQGRRKQGS